MKYCKNCQRIANNDELYCISCGTSLTDNSNEEVSVMSENDKSEKMEAEKIEQEKIEPEIIKPEIIKPEIIKPVKTEPEYIRSTQVINKTYSHEVGESVDLIKKIALIALAVFIAPVGLIVGLVMMSDKAKYKKEFGQILVIVAAAVFVAATLCCCVFGTYAIALYSA